MSFSDLKKRSGGSIEDLQKKLEAANSTKNYKDDRFWRPELDKSSNGYAEIRFLPAPENEELPWVKVYSHAFQGPGGWYIENSLTTISKKDPVSELNTQLWNSGLESDKDIARERRRKLNYISNILIVSDPANPQNEGKVFLFKYGKKIFDKINEAMNPEFEDEAAINPFDFWKGASFKLKVRKVAGYINYDKSHFEAASVLGEDEAMEVIWKTQQSLQQFVAEDQFKSPEELSERLTRVLGGDIRGKMNSNPPTAESHMPVTEDTSSTSSDTTETSEDAFLSFESLREGD